MVCTDRLPKPVAEVWDWQRLGACRGANDAVFFHPDSERGAAREARETRAKAICQRCPVLASCREYALAAEEPYGVWGGLGEQERRVIVAQRHQRRAA